MAGATRRTLDAILDALLDAFPSQGRDLGLRRAARLLCAVGMHTQGMTLDEATAEFETTAGLDPDHPRLEAVRGTWDPGCFGYTLGKLEILALRDLAGGDLRAFQDRLLANGTPPPAIVARHLVAGSTAHSP